MASSLTRFSDFHGISAARCSPAHTHRHLHPQQLLTIAQSASNEFPSVPERSAQQQQQTQYALKATVSINVQALPNVAASVFSMVESPSATETMEYVDLHPKLSQALITDTPAKPKHHDEQEMQLWIDIIRSMFQTMTYGEISVSAYDTAWVAMVPSLDGSRGKPQFPNCLNWIIDNQLADGSWGDTELFLTYDRVCSTVACLVALKTWNIGENNIHKGVRFVQENLPKLTQEAQDYMPIGFEVVFPTMLDDARDLGLDLPYEAPVVLKIREEREKKLKSIPMELLHSQPTTLLHSLEGLHKLVDWSKLLKLQSKNGSFLFSPASTACALKYTGNKKCLDYLNSILDKYNDAVPNVYPVDLFEHLWMVDRLERLGIARYFKTEIKQCLDYVFKQWTKRGISWASDSDVTDVDDTAMGFRLLRLHGYPVSPEVFHHFKRGDKFFCFEGQTSQAVTGMYNLHRASQTMLPGETILEDANHYTRAFLRDRQEENKIQDKWIISKGLEGEVAFTLSNPWYESLPRIETRHYIDHYGVDDVWIGKSLYRMFFVNNQAFLNLAISDYNLCQSFYQRELGQILRWYDKCEFPKLKLTQHDPAQSLFLIAATLFEPQFSVARNVWTMCDILSKVTKDLFGSKEFLKDLKQFSVAVESWDPKLVQGLAQDVKIVFSILFTTVNSIAQEAFATQGRDVSHHLRNTWVRYVQSLLQEAEWKSIKHYPSLEEYMSYTKASSRLEPIVLSTLFFLGETIHEKYIQHSSFHLLMDMLTRLGLIKEDIQSYYAGGVQRSLTCVALYLRENPQVSEQGSIQHFHCLGDQIMKTIVKEYISSTNLPRQCKLFQLYMAKIINFSYSKRIKLH